MNKNKYRGFSRTYQEWVTGYLVEREEPHLHQIIDPIGKRSSVTTLCERDSIGQFTGRKDKNDVEIYEYDIVRLTSNDGIDYLALIIFKDGAFVAVDGSEDNYAVVRRLDNFDVEIEVVGKLYENKELLEVN